MNWLSCLLALLLASSAVGADALDGVLSFPPENPVVSEGEITLVHYFHPACDCCREAEQMLTKESRSFRYLPVLTEAGELPRFEVYDERARLRYRGERALEWVSRNSRLESQKSSR